MLGRGTGDVDEDAVGDVVGEGLPTGGELGALLQKLVETVTWSMPSRAAEPGVSIMGKMDTVIESVVNRGRLPREHVTILGHAPTVPSGLRPAFDGGGPIRLGAAGGRGASQGPGPSRPTTSLPRSLARTGRPPT